VPIGRPDLRLAFVVASRREDEWRGVVPDPRFHILPLTQFKEDVVRQALYDLAQQMEFSFPHDMLQRNAASVLRLSEGLPALLAGCLQWIQSQQWDRLDRLDTQELFESLARPYIKDRLLSLDSLFPRGGENLGAQREALEEAFRALAPYRFFTQAHLRHVESAPALAEVLDRLDWTIEDLGEAISNTAPLERPLDELWQEIHAAIRRLLYRYYYKSSDERVSAHVKAGEFIGVWANKQMGREQVIGLVECLWHEAAALQIERPANMEARLSQTARKLSTNLTPSPAYTTAELRAYAAERMHDDEELQEALRDLPGLLDQLIGIVKAPQESRQ
jgi:hypothetical protein